MGTVLPDALLERVMTYVHFVVYDSKARLFVLCVQRGYVDATGLGLEHQHVRFSNLCSAIFKDKTKAARSAWEALAHTERQVIHLVCPETTTDYLVLKETRFVSTTDIYRLIALWQFVAYEGHADLARILQSWRFLQVVAAAVKGGNRASQWILNAWQQLTPEEQNAWQESFGPQTYYKAKEIKRQLTTTLGVPFDALTICPNRRDLLAFHDLVLKTTGSWSSSVSSIPGVTWRATRALTALVDSDKSPFPLAMVALFVNDEAVVSALRDYLAFWRGYKTPAVFKRWDGSFWQERPAALYYVNHVVRRYARLKSSLVRFVAFGQPKRGEEQWCPCDTTALYCKDCLEIKSIPNFSHPPPGRSLAFDVNANRVVCQLCKSTRVIGVPLFNPRNPSTTLTLSHPDRAPLHICDGSPFCFIKTSYTGTCRTCQG